MGKDKYRSGSRSPERRRREDSDDERSGYRKSKDERRRRSPSADRDSNDEAKKERKRMEKEARKREKEEEKRRARGDGGENLSRGEYVPSGYSYVSTGAREEYRAQGNTVYPSYEYQQREYRAPYGGGYREPPYPQDGAGGYAQPSPPPQAYGYAPPPRPGGEYYTPPYPAQYPPPAPQQGAYTYPAGGYQSSPPLPPPQQQQQYPYQQYPPPQQGQYQQYPPPQQPYPQQYPSPQAQSPYAPQGGFQGYQAPPSQGEYKPTNPPPASYAETIDHNSKPTYSSGQAAEKPYKYKPQAHSSAQNAEGPAPTFPTPATPSDGGGIFNNFAKTLNASLHNYARNVFPATSTYSNMAPEAKTGQRFESFAPVRNGNGAKWYVDGKDYMYAVSVALDEARESIWILDWWLSPELYLRRPPKLHEKYRLDRMLQAAASRGVRVNVIVYKEVTQALTLDSHHTKHALEDLHPNICVFRHPDHLPDRDNVIRDTLNKFKSGDYRFLDGIKGVYGFKDDITLYFAHHEKLCIVDGQIAFMGGLDLCFGRWDTNEHPIADAHPGDLNAILFPGQDYNNARYLDFQHVDKWEDNVVSRLEHSRMGWSDIAMSLMGPAVEDLQVHFAQRWNFIYKDKYDARRVARYKPIDESAFEGGHGYHRRHIKDKLKQHVLEGTEYDFDYSDSDFRRQRQDEPDGVRLQICRSISKWSHGTVTTEHSIANAYIQIITEAKHFVYMENQFFITATSDQQKPILNMVGRAIVDRIIRAYREGKRFRIIVVIPAIPGFAGDLKDSAALGTRAIIEFQQRSINRDRGYSIMEQLEKQGINPKEYIRFYNLRSYDRINNAQTGSAGGVPYEAAAQAHDEQVGAGVNYQQYGGPIRGDEYSRYQSGAPSQPQTKGQWDSVARCVMLGGPDIRSVPWDGDPDKEIDAFVSEELYVHSKLLIADDTIALIGSANLNDRSQLGDHDSEIACIIEDRTPLPSMMDGKPYRASHFAATLRRQVFRKHLGLIPAQNCYEIDQNMMPIPVPNIYDFDSAEDRLVQDPLSDEFWGFWNQVANVNTRAFAKVFHSLPHDSVQNWKQYDEYWGKHFAIPKPTKDKKPGDPEPKAKEPWGHVVKDEFSPGREGAREVKEVLAAIRGMLVEMPLDFLKEEDVAEEGVALNAFTETLYT